MNLDNGLRGGKVMLRESGGCRWTVLMHTLEGDAGARVEAGGSTGQLWHDLLAGFWFLHLSTNPDCCHAGWSIISLNPEDLLDNFTRVLVFLRWGILNAVVTIEESRGVF